MIIRWKPHEQRWQNCTWINTETGCQNWKHHGSSSSPSWHVPGQRRACEIILRSAHGSSKHMQLLSWMSKLQERCQLHKPHRTWLHYKRPQWWWYPPRRTGQRKPTQDTGFTRLIRREQRSWQKVHIMAYKQSRSRSCPKPLPEATFFIRQRKNGDVHILRWSWKY